MRCAICPCRNRRLEGEDEKEAKKRKEDEDDDDSKSEVSLLITEFDSDEEPDEEDPRDVEEEEEEREQTVEGWVPGPEPPECCCAEPLAAIKQAFDEWIAYNAERKAILEPLREEYKVARAKCMTHRYLHFIFISWNLPLF